MHKPALLFTVTILCSVAGSLDASEALRGYHRSVSVSRPTRLDAVFPLANQSPAKQPAGWLSGDYDSAKQTYELYVPPAYDDRKAWPVVLFISPGDTASGYRAWRTACTKAGVIFAGPHAAGNRCPVKQRVRIVMDVLDDVRRRFHVDPDRTYIGGFSGGGRIACAIAFSQPELFGGVIPVCAAGDLRSEPWLRHRVIDRLSVALVTGTGDFNRGEVERFRGPLLKAVGVRTRVWTVRGLGHAIPTDDTLASVLRWVDSAAAGRRKLAARYPATRLADDETPTRDAFAAALLKEAKQRIARDGQLYRGLQQLIGVRTRWSDTAAAQEATAVLQSFDRRRERPWEAEDLAEQRRFLIARARGLDAYATGKLSKVYERQRKSMAAAARDLWKLVLRDGQDAQAVAEAQKRVPVLDELANRP